MAVDPLIWPPAYRLIGDNAALISEFSALLDNCGCLPADHSIAQIVIDLNSRGAPALIESDPIIEWRGLAIRRAGSRALFEYQDWQLELSLDNRAIAVWGPPPAIEQQLFFREFFLRSALLYLLRRNGFYELHAAAGQNDQAGYILLGQSSSGKTSALLAMMRSGWHYAGDDALLLRAQAGDANDASRDKIIVYPLRKKFSLTANYLTAHPELARYAVEVVPGTDKRRLSPEQIWPQQFIPQLQPHFIIGCRIIAADKSAIVPIARAHALARMVASTPWIALDRETAAAQLDLFRSTAATCYSFELSAGRDLLQDRQRLVDMLAPDRLMECWRSAKEG
jgi:hypothetical protein